ncbi:MAG TPA: siderophore-interacting protein [Xanthobacteraceae bacterium]|jgi:NADPH-dependent ferric siderophore reductase|nr:siderophore-interacting protein [Xanthobacteraceae bacterium]
MSETLTKSAFVPVPGGREIPAPEGVDPVLFKRRMGRLFMVNVEKAFDITPRMRRVQLASGDLGGLTLKPGQEIILRLPQANGEVLRRHYTIRKYDAANNRIDVDFVLHGNSPATTWARGVTAGDYLEFTGPRGRVVLQPEADWHVFVGDETCIPGIFNMVEALPEGARAYVFLEAGSADEKQPLDAVANVSLEWLLRNGAHAGPSRILSDRLDAFTFPSGNGHAYVIGETSNARAIRRSLIARGFPKDQISAEGYWRPGRVGGHDHVDDEH